MSLNRSPELLASRFYYESMGSNDPQCMANWDPRGVVGRIYIGDHQTLLHT